MIVFFWVGCALLAVAFHPLPSAASGSPTDVFAALQSRIGSQSSAYTS